jgi:hypothetical protein
LGISGDADDPDGLVFTDARGRPLAPAGKPTPPSELVPTGNWVHPSGERLDGRWVHFSPPPGSSDDAPRPVPAGSPSPAHAWPTVADLEPCPNDGGVFAY